MSKYQATAAAKTERLAVYNEASSVLKKQVAADAKASVSAYASPYAAALSYFTDDKMLNKLGVSSGALKGVEATKKEVLNPKTDVQQQILENTNNATVDINVKDNTGSAEVKSDNKFVQVKTTSTMLSK